MRFSNHGVHALDAFVVFPDRSFIFSAGGFANWPVVRALHDTNAAQTLDAAIMS